MSDSEQFRVPNQTQTRAKSAWFLPSQKSWYPLVIQCLPLMCFGFTILTWVLFGLPPTRRLPSKNTRRWAECFLGFRMFGMLHGDFFQIRVHLIRDAVLFGDLPKFGGLPTWWIPVNQFLVRC